MNPKLMLIKFLNTSASSEIMSRRGIKRMPNQIKFSDEIIDSSAVIYITNEIVVFVVEKKIIWPTYVFN